jgi:exosortase/archaeosortase family protein
MKRKSAALIQLGLRLIIFLAIVFALIPFLQGRFAPRPQTLTLAGIFPEIFVALALLVFFIHNRNELLGFRWKFSWTDAILAFCIALPAFAIKFVLIYGISTTFSQDHPFVCILGQYFFGIVGAMAVAFAVFSSRFIRKFWKSLLVMICALMIYFGIVFLIRLAWRLLAEIIAYGNSSLLGLLGFASSAAIGAGDPSIAADGFSVVIGSPCSGVDSLAMFIGLFSIVLLLDWHRIDRKKVWKYFAAGLIGMFVVSFIRITLLMVIGARISEAFAMNLFHNNAGWLLFIIYSTLFFWFAYPKLIKK